MHGDRFAGPIRWRMHIPVPVDRVFAALSTDEGRASFWATSARERNGVIRFEFANGVEHHATVIERAAPRRFSLQYFQGVASFELTPVSSEATDLLLVHTGVAPEEWSEVHAGWLNVLFPLKAMLAFGVDLRNHDPKRTWDQGYADQ